MKIRRKCFCETTVLGPRRKKRFGLSWFLILLYPLIEMQGCIWKYTLPFMFFLRFYLLKKFYFCCFLRKRHGPMVQGQSTDGQTDGQTHSPSYREKWTKIDPNYGRPITPPIIWTVETFSWLKTSRASKSWNRRSKVRHNRISHDERMGRMKFRICISD